MGASITRPWTVSSRIGAPTRNRTTASGRFDSPWGRGFFGRCDPLPTADSVSGCGASTPGLAHLTRSPFSSCQVATMADAMRQTGGAASAAGTRALNGDRIAGWGRVTRGYRGPG